LYKPPLIQVLHNIYLLKTKGKQFDHNL